MARRSSPSFVAPANSCSLPLLLSLSSPRGRRCKRAAGGKSCPTTFNEQTQAFDDTPELQELECHANLYGLQRENGWFVYDGQLEHELEHPAAEPHHSAAADERDQKLMEAMVLCPPKYL